MSDSIMTPEEMVAYIQITIAERLKIHMVDLSRYPHKCQCGAPAYIGFSETDCSAKCGGR